ncbi:hypothetical protein ACFCXS_35660 [Streptomyces sp. NPDC056373]|uniref:hypothetical protein n=1 Tax=Streptomyces sp. NPDC056373 TaxID=3345798 RepID=UPI0035E24885
MRACFTAARTVEPAGKGSVTIRAASSWPAADTGRVIEAAIFWAAVRAAPAYGVEASAAARATAGAEVALGRLDRMITGTLAPHLARCPDDE